VLLEVLIVSFLITARPVPDPHDVKAHPEKYPTQGLCSTLSNTTCEECTSAGCDWCESDSDCFAKINILGGCQDNNWRVDNASCKFYPPRDIWEENVAGCTDNNAINNKFVASVSDESCKYGEGVEPSNYLKKECVCGIGGFEVPYGRFCGKGYTGRSGQLPCDFIDRCCQIHGFLFCCCWGVLLE